MSFEIKVGIVELLGDILNVHGKAGEAEVTQSLDEDNVVIIEEKPKGIISKGLDWVKGKIKDKKQSKTESEKATNEVTLTNDKE